MRGFLGLPGLLFALALSAWGQGNNLNGQVSWVARSTAPSGVCSARQASVYTPSGAIYTCVNGTWTAGSGGGGGVSSVIIAGTANKITASGTCTITTSGTCTLTIPTGVVLVAPVLGTPASGNASNLSNLPITLTTTGTSGASTWTQGTNTLNIPQYAGTGTVTVVGAGNLTNTALVTGGGSQAIQTPATTATMDSSGNISTPGTITSGSGSGIAGGYQYLQGTASTPAANSIVIQAPTSVTTAYSMALPGAAGTGFMLNTDSSNVDAITFVGFSGTGNVARVASPTFTGIPAGPTASQNNNSTQFSTTAYTDLAVANAIAAVNPAIAVLAASTASITGTYSNGVAGIGATFTVTATGAFTLDGIAINTIGQRVLLKNQSSAFQNGMYTATVVGTTGVSPIFTRALDYDTPSDINSTGAIPVQSGTANSDTSWLLTSSVATMGTDALTYIQFTIAPTSLVTAASPGVGLCHFAGSTQACTSSAVTSADATGNTSGSGNFCLVTSCTMVTPALGTPSALVATNITGIPAAQVPAVALTTGTSITLSNNARFFECTSTCTITMPVPSAGVQYCVRNSNNVATVITFAAIGSSARYENTASTAYGAAGTGTLISAGAVGDKMCLVGLDATHYDVFSFAGTWTAS